MNVDFDTILQAYKTHGTQKKAAKALGIGLSRFQRVLYANGHKPGRGCQNRKMTPDQALDAYKKYGSQAKAAAALGVSQPALGSMLLRHYNLQLRVGGPVIHALPMDTIAQEYQSGQSTIALGRKYGVDPEVIRHRLKRIGIGRRQPGGHSLTGSKNHQWKGGYQQPMHYYRRQSYEVAAICLGQPLPRGVVIHHLDEDPTNNHHTNLWLFESQGHHSSYHQKLLAILRQDGQVEPTRLLTEIGAVALPPPPAPIEYVPGTGQPSLSDTELLERLRQRASVSKQGPYGRLPNPVSADPQE